MFSFLTVKRGRIPQAAALSAAAGTFLSLTLALCRPCSAMDGGIYSLDAGRLLGIAGLAVVGSIEVTQVIGESVGVEPMSGGDITLQTPYLVQAPLLATSLRQAYCYPSPYRPALGHTKLTFTNLPARVKLKVFDISGGLVYSAESDTASGKLEWGVVNNSGSRIASGVYIYQLSSGGEKRTGRFAVIR